MKGLGIHLTEYLFMERKGNYPIEGMIKAKNCYIAKENGHELHFFSISPRVLCSTGQLGGAQSIFAD